MSGPAPTVVSAIAEASRVTGVSPQFLQATARRESSFDPDARASTSSAAGLYQFIESTWIETLERHGQRLGFADAVAQLESAEGRGEALELRFDPRAAALMAGALASDNARSLEARLGRAPDAGELYVAHVLGAEGAATLLETAAVQPEASASELFPAAARANRGLFYDAGGNSRSVSALARRLRGAISADAAPLGPTFVAQSSPGARPVIRSLGESSPRLRIASTSQVSYAPPVMLRGGTMPLRLAAPVVEALAALEPPERAERADQSEQAERNARRLRELRDDV